jgi:hypothetical protein
MTEKAAFQATFVDQRPVKGRKQHQFIFEVPAEAANRALQILGGLPNPMDSVWVGIARLKPESEVMQHSEPDRRDNAMPAQEPEQAPARARITLAQRAGMLCGDRRFHRFLVENSMMPFTGKEVINQMPDHAATAVRMICGVKSRSEILPNTPAGQAFEELHAKYTLWLKHPDLVA